MMLQSSVSISSKEIERFPIEDGRKPFRGLPDKDNVPKFLQFVKEVMKLKSRIEDVKEFISKPSHSRLVKLFPIVLGIKPENELYPISRSWSFEALVMKLGNLPLKLLKPISNTSTFGSPKPIIDGRLPENLLLLRARIFNVEMLKSVIGMWPTRLLFSSPKPSRIGRLPISKARVDPTPPYDAHPALKPWKYEPAARRSFCRTVFIQSLNIDIHVHGPKQPCKTWWQPSFSVARFENEQSQLKYLEWPSFQSTLKTATPTLVLVALLIVAPSSSLSVMDDTCYDRNVFINTHSVYRKF
ncbi:hypothetical protein LWI29_009423 [Acer saccharum]|uniref:Uncharacterized protein n=1 Tax=Acer saccharum TaxID=4024 RepID=A0AA39SC65_ACESA|nr:hypothetical protein LWI29_009423 [Acer saccharum]